MRGFKQFSAATLFVMLLGCAHEPRIGQGRVSHVVVCWLKQPGDAEARWKLIEASESFRTLPGVEEIIVGRPIASTRPVVDATYDISVVMIFKDADALRAYENSTQHQQAVRDVLKPYVARFIVYDAQERHPKGKDG